MSESSGSPGSLRAAFKGVNWERLNYILIPSARSRRPIPVPLGEPVSLSARALLRLYRAFTREGRAVFGATLLAAAFSVDVGHTKVYLLFVVLGAALLASLALSPWMRLGDVTITVRAPARVMVGSEAAFVVECDRGTASATSDIHAEGPFLPYFGRWTGSPPAMERAPGGAEQVTLRARFSERGDLTLGRFRVSARVPMGLANGPAIESAPVRLRVVPRPANVTAVTFPVANRSITGGAARAANGGESTDLRGVRPYRAGDRVRDLSARTWARTGKPAVREYQDEHLTRVGVMLDWCAPPRPRRADDQAFEAAVSLTAGLVARLGRGDTLVSVLGCNGVAHGLGSGRGAVALDLALDRLAAAELDARPDRAQTARLLAPYLANLSTLVMVVDRWDEARESFARGIESSGVIVRAIAVGEPQSRVSGERIRGVSIEAVLLGAPVVA